MSRGQEAALLDILSEKLETAGYPVRDLRMHPFGQSETEMHAILLPSSVDAEALDRLSAQFGQMPQVHQALWNQSAGD